MAFRGTSMVKRAERVPGIAAIRWGRLLRFIAVGLAATATDFTVFNIAIAPVNAPTRPYILVANTLAFATATCVGYTLNSRYTFRAAPDRRSLVRYVLVAIVGAAVYDGSLLVLLHLLSEYDTVLLNVAKVAAVALAAAWNFVGFSLFVFAAPAAAVADDRVEARP